MDMLRGNLVFKGERGYSAYEVAVQNGFQGTEQDWLAKLGTSSHFSKKNISYVPSENVNYLSLPADYNASDSFLDVYVDGLRLESDTYTINTTTKKIELVNSISADKKVEIVILSLSTNNLPIVQTIDEDSNNTTAPGTKAVYDYVESKASTINSEIEKINNKFIEVEGQLLFDNETVEVEEEV